MSDEASAHQEPDTPSDDVTDEGADVNEAPEDSQEDDQDEAPDYGRIQAKIRKQNNELKNLRQRTKEAEEKAAGVDEKDTKISSLEAENLRLRVGAKHGLPGEIIDRLRGETEEEVLADAEKLLELITPKSPPSRKPKEALRGGGDPTEEPSETDLNKLGERMFAK